MEYHPGGEDELMRAAGTDGTDLFDQVRTTGSKWQLLTVLWKMHVLQLFLGHFSENDDLNFFSPRERQDSRSEWHMCWKRHVV